MRERSGTSKKICLANRKKAKPRQRPWNRFLPMNIITKNDPETQVRRDLQYLANNRFVRERPDNSTRLKDGNGRFLS
jgi:hypothetical protein